MEQTLKIPEPSQKFSNIQLELLRLYSHNVSDEELLDIRDILGKYFLRRLSDEVNDSIDQNNIQPADLENWLNENS